MTQVGADCTCRNGGEGETERGGCEGRWCMESGFGAGGQVRAHSPTKRDGRPIGFRDRNLLTLRGKPCIVAASCWHSAAFD